MRQGEKSPCHDFTLFSVYIEKVATKYSVYLQKLLDFFGKICYTFGKPE